MELNNEGGRWLAALMTAPGISVAYQPTCTPQMCRTSVAYQILVRYRCVAHLTATSWRTISGVPLFWYATDVKHISGVPAPGYATDGFPHLAAERKILTR